MPPRHARRGPRHRGVTAAVVLGVLVGLFISIPILGGVIQNHG